MEAELEVEPRESLLSRIGNTPLVEIRRILPPGRVRILAKLEGFNPGGSVKDRAAYNMIRTAEEQGVLRPGGTLIDSTSGNTGIAYAMIGAARGYDVLLAMPSNASVERKKILRAYGARIRLTDSLEGSDGAIREIRRLYRESPEKYFYPDQYSNDANWRAHYETTALEIYRQTHGEITHFVAGSGNEWNLCRSDPPSQGAEPSDSGHLLPARFPLPWPGGPQAHAHGAGSLHLRSESG